jgi:3-methyladenine DNA glycosylase AlkC
MEPFKNAISPEVVFSISGLLQKHLPGFDPEPFETTILATLAALELKQRVQLIADQLHAVLPADLTTRNAILAQFLAPTPENKLDGTPGKEGLQGWAIYPVTMVIGQHGVANFDESMQLLKEMTKRFTAEFDVRYFLIADQPRALQIMNEWAENADKHVRRLASEGSRPRLPWGAQLSQLVADPTPTLHLLKILRDDSEEYVRRSVANHLNDISKDHPDLIAHLAQEWMQGADKNRERLLRHACRSLIKQGHAVALAAFGIHPPKVNLNDLTIKTATVKFGTAVIFTAKITSSDTQKQAIIVDYLVHFLKANGQKVGKVFKWKKISLLAGETLVLSKSHPIRAITTRKYYPGQQAISLRINGHDFGLTEFELEGPCD